MTSIPFSKYEGCGNDFILIDNREDKFQCKLESSIRNLCRRRLGIGADGVVLLEESRKADFRMRIFNADGSEAEMCGNALRCLGKFLRELGIPGKQFAIEVTGNIYSVRIEDPWVTVTLPPPSLVTWSLDVPLDALTMTVDYLDTGVPHAVIFTDDIESVDLLGIGSKIRHHPLFSPRGTNVNFATLAPNGKLMIRTYERGVEGETLACGTGATAVAIAAARKYHLSNPIVIVTRSKEEIEFHLIFNNDTLSQILMKGPANFVYSGNLPTDNRSAADAITAKPCQPCPLGQGNYLSGRGLDPSHPNF